MIYILSNYCEDGAELVIATTDESLVQAMLESRKHDDDAEWEDTKAELAKLLQEHEPAMEYGHKLQRGWGGIMLHIIEEWKP